MNSKEIEQFMSFNKDCKLVKPLAVFLVNGDFIVGVYKGSLSKYDILIKYRQKIKNNWSRIRTPKHIHWAVDILLKMNSNKKTTKEFLDFLILIWSKTKPIKSAEDMKEYLDTKNLLKINKREIKYYEKLSKKGEYSINFLVLLAKLLMIQEKTNLETSYMFKGVLEAQKFEKDIFSIVSTATHNRR